MAKKRERVGAVIGALIFLGSSLTASVAVIYLMVTNKGQNNKTDTSTTSSQTSSTSPLVGKPMQNFTPVASVPTLQIIDTTVGTGAEATASSTVTADYVGALATTGVVFDASPTGQPATFALSQVIQGWQQGVPGMKVGGVRRLLIPAALAYGASSPSAAIPANSDLVFDITLSAVK